MHLTYFWLDFGTLLFPLLLSFDRKVAFFRQWKFLFPAILLVGAFFLIWDYFFTIWGVWGFNEVYLTGAFLGPLPLEEIAFFVVVPYACVFVYACLKVYIPKDPLRKVYRWLNLLVMLLCLFALWRFNDRLYTAVTALFLFAVVFSHARIWKSAYMGYFYLAWFICILPMVVVNGVLTALPVVWYDNAQNMAFRTGSIPIEDYFYNMLCMLMNIGIYEALQRRAVRRLEKRAGKEKSVSPPPVTT